MNIYLFDIETAPSLGYYFDLWKEGNIVGTKENWYILSFAIKELGTGKVQTFALPDFRGYKKNKEDDRLLVHKLWEFFDKADILIAHNGDAFDIKKANARFIHHRLTPPSPYKTVDTLKLARRHFKFDSNKLDALAQSLGLGAKLPHTGFNTWKGCMTGDMKAWAIMRKYNAHDVVLLEKVYNLLKAWGTHPNLNILTRENACPKCQSKHWQKRGFKYTATSEAQIYNCMGCGTYFTGKPEKLARRVYVR